MSFKKLLVLPLASAVCAACFAADGLRAIVSRDAELAFELSRSGRSSIPLEAGREVWIQPELSGDGKLYVASAPDAANGVLGWIDRDAVRWPDGTAVPASAEPAEVREAVADTDSPPKVGVSKQRKKGPKPVRGVRKAKGARSKHTRSTARAETGTGKSRHSHAARRGKSRRSQEVRQPVRNAEPGEPAPARVQQVAQPAAARVLPAVPDGHREAASAQEDLSRMLLGLVSDTGVRDYARSVARSGELSRDEKVKALKIYYKYLQEKRSRLGDADAAEREELRKQSEDLLAHLASLDGKSASRRPAGAAKPSKPGRVASKARRGQQPRNVRPRGEA
ncbi:MAG: hypothetical protein HY816_17565 [Candidatus Wallbacteria bacterium]|nr:hypothetical protein [Candidatus Wallbacteria bacterium]